MKEKKIGLAGVLLFSLCLASLQAQQSSNAAGGNAVGAGGSAAYSVGEVTYGQAGGETGSQNSGVQQPYVIMETSADQFRNITLDVTVFPNPTQSTLNLKVTDQELKQLRYDFYDLNGRLLIQKEITSKVTSIPVQSLAAATYILKVLEGGTVVKTFTVIKTN